jgi:ParB-like chromosome segregation protein Spo0J
MARPLRRRLGDLHHDPANAREHTEANVAAIARSLERFGQQRPLVIRPDGTVIAGNGTLEAARSLGWRSLWVQEFTGTDAEARAFAIADNRTAELAAWNAELLYDQLTDLGDLAAAAGFTSADLDDLAAQLEEEVELPGEPEAPSDPDRYALRATRLVILEYPSELYVWVVGRLDEERARLGVDSNAAALVAICQDLSPVPAPEVPDGA